MPAYSPWGRVYSCGVALFFMPGWEMAAFSALTIGLPFLLDREVAGLRQVKFDVCDPPRRIPTPYLALWIKVPKAMCYLAPELLLLRRLGKTPSCPGAPACGGYALALFVGEAAEGLEPAKGPTLVGEEHIRQLFQ